MGAKTQRERDYLEAVAAYYEDFANRTERARQLARAKAYEALAARYPDDDEAQIFYALVPRGDTGGLRPDLCGLAEGGRVSSRSSSPSTRIIRAWRTT